ncbi:AI-2E family transporter [Flavisolibacter tropicus]|uniref:Transporter n=1 Tax=Flavisolibacter tropicus TaxID=1492898 RepID=A0A172TZP3_9BACT|nr:AI-2E family transporter [Flavisolibacter tropicus]ANE52476.1 transporter [Flavisolibacter tropicus]
MRRFSLSHSVQVLLFSILLIVALYYGRAFLVPLVFAGILSMLLLPVTERLEQYHFPKALAIVCADLLVVAVVAGIIGLISWQITDLANNAAELESNITQKVEQLKQFIATSLGVSAEEQQQMLKKQQDATSSIGQNIAGVFSFLGSILTDFLLVLIYIFLFLYYRNHLYSFVLKLVEKEKQEQARDVMEQIEKTSRNYFSGLIMMIGCLWIMYGIGFSIVGAKSPIFFAILCGILELVPFVGNLAGTTLAVLMNVAQGSDTSVLIGIVVTYAVVQFLQSYILEPLVVGDKVRINPLFTIGGIVAGELIWGIPGMIMAIPLLGMTKIICDHIESLQPYGFLIGAEEKRKKKDIKNPLTKRG